MGRERCFIVNTEKKAAFWKREKRTLIKFVGGTEVTGIINTAGIET